MLKMQTLSLFVLIALMLKCTSIKQGIEGKLIWVEGNQMPGPDRKPAPAQGVVREVYIYPLLSMSDVKIEGVFVSEVNQKPIIKIQSHQNGNFAVNLPPGEYSILIKEADGFFVNSFDSQNHLNPVLVKSRGVTRMEIIINYRASY
jgi:hypothetical protein